MKITFAILSFLFAQVLLPALFSAEHVVRAGQLELRVHISKTAHLFYVVDQLSKWSYFCHPDYAYNITDLSKEEIEMLSKHREIRKNHGWGDNLERVFYSELDLDAAFALGISNGWISETEANVERLVFATFEPRIGALMRDHQQEMDRFVDRLISDIPKLQDEVRAD